MRLALDLRQGRALCVGNAIIPIDQILLEDIKMVFERVAKILASYKDVDASTIDIDASFGDLGLDSLDTVEIVMSLEDEFGIEIEMNESLKTVRDLVNLIEGK